MSEVSMSEITACEIMPCEIMPAEITAAEITTSEISPSEITPSEARIADRGIAETKGRLRVLQVHNHSAPGWGGEDTVVELEARLLRARGHTVGEFTASAAELKTGSVLRQMLAAPGFLWSRRSYSGEQRKIAEFEPDIVHVHSTFPTLSPSVLWASHRARVAVVQTLHNFRQLCTNALLSREDRRCEKCVGQSPFPALRYRCYKNSLPRTAVMAAIGTLHSKLGTYRRAVDTYIMLNEFNREIFLRGKFPGRKLMVKPNFVPVSELGRGPRRNQAVFAGEVTRSKGVHLLLDAWRMAALPGFELLLIGDSPERKIIQQRYGHMPHVTWCGRLSRSEVLEHIAASRILVFPSLAYENCPMVLLEALSVATPVVAANHPSLQAIVRHECEGLLFNAGDPRALAAALGEALLAGDDTWTRWSKAARRTQEERYSEEVSYSQLIAIYRAAIQNKSAPTLDRETTARSRR